MKRWGLCAQEKKALSLCSCMLWCHRMSEQPRIGTASASKRIGVGEETVLVVHGSEHGSDGEFTEFTILVVGLFSYNQVPRLSLMPPSHRIAGEGEFSGQGKRVVFGIGEEWGGGGSWFEPCLQVSKGWKMFWNSFRYEDTEVYRGCF